MSGYKEFYGKGALLKYFPDQKTIVLTPKDKLQFLKLKSKIDTLLQIDGTKRTGNTFTLKLNDSFNVNVSEVLKSLGLKGGIEKEDASSLVDDATKESDDEAKKLQNPEGQPPPPNPQMPPVPGQPPQMPGQPPEPPIPEAIRFNIYSMLFEDFYTPEKQQRRKSKRTGKYWEALERFSGKNRGAIEPQDILEIRKKFSLKPRSNERDEMLYSLDRAAAYFFSRIEKIKGPAAAEDFDQRYTSIDNLTPDDYPQKEDMEQDSEENLGSSQMTLTPDFSNVDYSDVEIER